MFLALINVWFGKTKVFPNRFLGLKPVHCSVAPQTPPSSVSHPLPIGVPASRVNDIVHGKRSISADTALRFGKYFGLPAQFWLNLQNDYDLRKADKTAVAKIEPLKPA